MIFNTIVIATLSLSKLNYVLLKFLGIHYSFKNMTFFVFLRNEGIFVATLHVKGGEVSDSSIILMLNMAT